MKKTLLNVAVLAMLFLSFPNLNAQDVLKIGDISEVNLNVTKTYQTFRKSSPDSRTRELVYQKEFYSENSSYVKLYFENFDLAPDDYLEITGKNSNEIILYGGKGKIVDQSGTMISDFWSRVIFDDRIEVKLYSLGKAGKHAGFSIAKVAYGYSNERINQILEENKGAKTNSICSSDDKERIACYEGTEMFNKAKAVARLIINGSSLCTGWLLGSEGHLMTNNHCIGSSTAANNTDFVFDYQYANCTGSTTLSSNVVAESSTLIKTSSSLDYTLVRLPVNPTGTYGYLSLSPNAPSAGDRIYIPQHPGGRLKEIAVTAGGSPATVNCTGNCGSRSTTYFADTEGGSSGSPVIDYNTNEVIAIHNTGGCPNGSAGRCDQLISAIGSSMPSNGIGDGTGGGGPDPDPVTCSSTVSSFPYGESFESGDGWSQVTGDDGNWLRDSNGTPSSSTGPSSAADGNFYMYLEASSNGTSGEVGANATAILKSPCFDLSGLSAATFSFSYHMYGSAMGSFSLEVSTDGTNWASLGSVSGNQGNQWNDASVNLSAYTGQSEVSLRFVGNTGSSWSSDLAIDNLSLTSGGSTPPACPALDLSAFTFSSFSNQDAAGNYSVGGNGSSVTLTNNTWKYIPMNYTVTANTVIEFEFSSTSQGEIHGIGFENDNSLTANRYFKVHGTQNYGITNFDNYSGGTVTYTIPVGDSYTGNMDRLVFINDNDAGSGNTSTFSNVKIYEGSCEGSVLVENFGTRTDVLGNEDELSRLDVLLSPNPITKGHSLKIMTAETDLSNASYSVINLLGKEVKSGFINKESTLNIDELKTGIYILSIRTNSETVNKRFVIE